MLAGGAGSDWIDGGTDDDALSGGDGDDIFVFSSGYGTDTITDFEGDIVYLRDLWIDDAQDLFDNYMAQDGNDVVISVFGGVLVIKNVTMAALDAGDFVIH